MAPAADAEPRRVESGCTSDHSAEMIPPQPGELESKQLGPAGNAALGRDSGVTNHVDIGVAASRSSRCPLTGRGPGWDRRPAAPSVAVEHSFLFFV